MGYLSDAAPILAHVTGLAWPRATSAALSGSQARPLASEKRFTLACSLPTRLTEHGTLFYNGNIPNDSYVGRSPYHAGAALEMDWNGRILWEVRHPTIIMMEDDYEMATSCWSAPLNFQPL
jgi:hypothetical protein